MFHTWFITWRTYGTWLPGDDGFVGYYQAPNRVIENEPGTATSVANPKLMEFSRKIMSGQPLELILPQAKVLFAQLQETTSHKNWKPHAIAILATHVHVVLSVVHDPSPSDILKTLKSYASRRLNQSFHLIESPRWFADRGSTRLVKGDRKEVVDYVRNQQNPLLVWTEDEPCLPSD